MTQANEIVFLPGFDGAGLLRTDFVEALGERHPRSVDTRRRSTPAGLRARRRWVGAESRPVLVTESFSGLVMTKWAARDPVADRALRGLRPQSVPWAALGTLPSIAQFSARA
jgi:hypothetical protein